MQLLARGRGDPSPYTCHPLKTNDLRMEFPALTGAEKETVLCLWIQSRPLMIPERNYCLFLLCAVFLNKGGEMKAEDKQTSQRPRQLQKPNYAHPKVQT